MGQHRAKAPKAPVTREPITPLIIQRLVAAVADDMSTRLKVLAGRHSRQDIISAIEPLSRMNLLQIGVVMNNIAAVQFLLSIGASKDVLWDPLDGVENSWDLSYMPDRVFNDFQNFCINLASPNVAQHAFEHSGFSLLHIAALVGHKEMVRFLVEQAGIPVDVRAAVTGATPLMTAITRGCVTESGLEGPPTHVCGITMSHEDASDVTCKPMLPIAQLLMELGADLGAVDNSGACMLATAAEAGRYGMMGDLLKHVPQVLDCCPKHAGHLLYAIVSNWVRTGSFDEGLYIFGILKGKYADTGRSQQFWEEIAAPIKRRKSAVVDRVLTVVPGNERMTTHALCRVMIGKSSNRYAAMKYLIEQGVPISALRLGQEHYTVTGHCDVDMLTLIVGALTEVHGQRYLEQHYDIIFGLWADSMLHPETSPEELATRHILLEKCAAHHHDIGLIGNQSLWPRRFSPELCRYGLSAHGKPVSPLVLAALVGVPGAVRSFLRGMMKSSPAGAPNPQLQAFLNQLDPTGRLPLIEAIIRRHFDDAEALVACGADFAIADGQGRMALHEVARRGHFPDRAIEFGEFCLSHLRLKSPKTRSPILNSVSPMHTSSRKSGVTLAELVLYMHAWYMLPQLVQLGMDVHWTPDEEGRGMLLAGAAMRHFEPVGFLDPAFLSGPSLPAALRAAHKDIDNLNALAFAVRRGNWDWVKPMLDACRRVGVDPDELLGWRKQSTPDEVYCPVLFAAVKNNQSMVHLQQAGYNLGPFVDYCIYVPLHGLHARSGNDAAPLVWEQFSMLMWAAAFGQPVAVKSLLQIGMDPNFQPTLENTWVPTAMSAALNLALIDHSPREFPTGNRLECILELLRWKAAVTQDQLSQVLQMMYGAPRSKVARELWAFLQSKAAACAACVLIGDWRTCARCKAAFYCSRSCQNSHWLQHRETCLPTPAKDLQQVKVAALHAASEA